ncbi:hypothetical protein M3Y96_01179200 [Aphelenchoides besseyi]|nr:hypothetical protein M3Y96_01179200 [Aphelenchoides besseyi]
MDVTQNNHRVNREPRPEERTNGHEADVEDDAASDNEQKIGPSTIEPEETGQNWLLRHLRTLLDDVGESTLSDFLMQQDITVYRNFLTDGLPRRCLFISVHRPQNSPSVPHFFENAPIQIPTEPVNETAEQKTEDQQNEEQIEDPKAAEEQLARDLEKESKTPTKTKRKMRPSRRTRSQPKKIVDIGKEPTDVTKKNPVVRRRSTKSKENTKSAKKKDEKKLGGILKDTKDPKIEKPITNIQPQTEQQNAVVMTDGGQIIVPIDMPNVSITPTAPEITLKWQSAERVPLDCDEFVFVATRDEPNSGVLSDFDRLYVVGHCKNAERFRRILDIAIMLLEKANAFERQIDLLLQLELPMAERREKWQDAENRFENFIADSLVYAFQSTPKRNQMESLMESIATVEVDVESIESLLRARIRAFTKSPTPEALVQVKLELSLYEIKFLRGELYTPRVVERLKRIVTIFAVLHMLYAQTTGEWIQKTLFHCVELTARILATNMHQRVWNLVYEDCEGERKPTEISDEKHAAIISETKPVLLELIDLGLQAMPPMSDEFLCLEKIGQCVRIIDFIEDEFLKLRSSIFDLRDQHRDMTFNRIPLGIARGIVRNVWSTFEESYFESALESGNYDAMKNVCLQLSELNVRMTDSLPSLDEFCLKGN